MTTELTKAAQQALEACPFCGSTNIKVHSYGDAVIGGEPDAFAQCHDCSVTGPNGKTEAEAVAAWNARALTQRPAAQAGPDRACGVMHLIEDYAKAVHDGDDALCQVLLRTIEASLLTSRQATPEPVGEPVGTVVHAKLNGQAKPWVTVALNQDSNLPDGTKLFTRPAPGVPEIDYTALIHASWGKHKYAQGTGLCIAFKHGAEWFRAQLAAAQAKGGQ